ncbi:ROK family protein (plasmid) [Photobacterium sp. DA100]|uniref:ROK family protein n=1 Tax=Photobacterium sp. DA100 TaxID=3027472 RepID=UPI0024793984|nr:ROK family protein [Photobacterium sp. DA100]WEM45938.1 ROK family protein [Photobacterium sp. DA100]
MRFGLDIGGTKIEIVAFDPEGERVYSKRISTPDNYPAFVTAVCGLVNGAEDTLHCQGSVGIGIPGTICTQTGLVKNANCTFINGHNLKNDLQRRLERDVFIANDANCFALSEAVDGAGKDGQVVFGVILGTGCGGGLVVNKQVLAGPNGIAGEWGHNPLPGYRESADGQEQQCYCGKRNCIERYISGSGLEMQYLQRFGEALKAADIIAGMQTGEMSCRLAYYQLVDQIARSFATIINMVDPDVIVIGGGLSNVASLFDDIPKQLTRFVMSNECRTKILPAQYGDSSGVRGAAWLPLS